MLLRRAAILHSLTFSSVRYGAVNSPRRFATTHSLCPLRPAVPPSYTARQRKAMLDAAALAKLSNVSLVCLSLPPAPLPHNSNALLFPLQFQVDSIAALAANYRIKHSHKIDSAAAAGEAHNVMFVDIG